MGTENHQPASGQKTEHAADFKNLLTISSEGHILMAGIILLMLYIFWLALQLIRNPADFHVLLGMTAAEVVFGRIACMGIGYSMDISPARVVLISMVLETILVLVFYPLFVFIWQQLLQIRWLRRLSDRTRKSAERHKDTVRKYGIIGLFTFVWLPFWMTGPVVGCMIGYLLGMRIWVNLATVLTGTYVAIVGWAWLLRQVHRQTLLSYAIVILAAIAAAAGLIWSIRHHFGPHHNKN